mmetsp:Transcript_18094/g.50294  ORF Transcript_18094/g.50294 Transcript_18094/m.50294 type:complete len:208 (-) Transcript_18094:1554-2177(-)
MRRLRKLQSRLGQPDVRGVALHGMLRSAPVLRRGNLAGPIDFYGFVVALAGPDHARGGKRAAANLLRPARHGGTPKSRESQIVRAAVLYQGGPVLSHQSGEPRDHDRQYWQMDGPGGIQKSHHHHDTTNHSHPMQHNANGGSGSDRRVIAVYPKTKTKNHSPNSWNKKKNNENNPGTKPQRVSRLHQVCNSFVPKCLWGFNPRCIQY